MDTLQRRQLVRVDDPGRLVGAAPLARRRRPSGRDLVRVPAFPLVARVWATVLSASLLSLLMSATGRLNFARRVDRAVLNIVDGSGPAWADSAARAVQTLGSTAGYRTLWVPTVLLLIWSARWRPFGVYLTTLSAVALAAQALFGDAALPRALRYSLTGSPLGYALPSWPVVVFAVVATATAYVLLPAGRRREAALTLVAGLAVALSLARVRLGHESITGDLTGALAGAAVAVLALTLLAPEAEFPVTYRRRNPAHLALDGERRDRIAAAVADQLGLGLAGIVPYRLAGSAGSTPCRLTVTGGPEPVLFGKLYATSHLRSDRWYKFARLLRYGALEDEGPFASVRRLAEHEDYMLRLFRDHGLRVPRPYGVVEVAPGREYLLVTGFVPDARELLGAEIDDDVLDDALGQVRLMWDAGVAHRDVKPSNVLVRGGRVHLIDLAFGELRPSAWRQAVDLANMMLTLALSAGAARVFARAARVFDPHEIAEAFAATGSVTIPRQLRRLIDATGSDPVAEFRSLAPRHPPIAIQRWSVRRVRLALITAASVAGALALLIGNLRAGHLL